MEHGVIEQVQGEGKSASSTVKMIYLANQAAIPVYRGRIQNVSEYVEGRDCLFGLM